MVQKIIKTTIEKCKETLLIMNFFIEKVNDEKIKRKKYKIEVARKVIKKEEEDVELHSKFTFRKENNKK